jgi:hypothetical protein
LAAEVDDALTGAVQPLQGLIGPFAERRTEGHVIEQLIASRGVAGVLGDCGQERLQRGVARFDAVIGFHGRPT